MNIKYLQTPQKPEHMDETQISGVLEDMEQDASFNTAPKYIKDSSASIALISFREQHMTYLKEHPKTNPEHYLANLRTTIRIRASK